MSGKTVKGGQKNFYKPPAPKPVAQGAVSIGRLFAQLMDETIEIQCNKIVNGRCDILACLQRGGYNLKLPPQDQIRNPTCLTLEIYKALTEAGYPAE